MKNYQNYVQLTTSSIRFFSNPDGYDVRELEYLIELARGEDGVFGEDEKRVLANIFRRVDKDARADSTIRAKIRYYQAELKLN